MNLPTLEHDPMTIEFFRQLQIPPDDAIDIGVLEEAKSPRQMQIFYALGLEPPAYAHLPMVMGPDGQKLSKRHGATSVFAYRDLGYFPEALLNYLVRLGWSHGDQAHRRGP